MAIVTRSTKATGFTSDHLAQYGIPVERKEAPGLPHSLLVEIDICETSMCHGPLSR